MLLVMVWASVINAAAVSTKAAPVQVFDQIPVVGTFAGGTFNGILDIVRFAVQGTGQNRQLVAVGTLSGTLTNTLGQVIGTVTDVLVTLPLTDAAGTCEILNLTLGPLDLNLLGLTVHLDTVHLVINAEQGPGNLLGNLLCAVAGLLDNPTGGPLGALAALLNQILGILG